MTDFVEQLSFIVPALSITFVVIITSINAYLNLRYVIGTASSLVFTFSVSFILGNAFQLQLIVGSAMVNQRYPTCSRTAGSALIAINTMDLQR